MRRSLPLLLGLLLPAPLAAQGLNLIPGVQEVASDSIGDIAVAAVDVEHPVVFYNPVMTRRYGPLLSRFFIAHEYGHIQLRHTRAGLAAFADTARDAIFRTQELEADCYAAALPGDDARAATEAALRFFARLGPFRFDNEHPTGAQRAARILMCLPGPRPEVIYGRGETGVEMGPVSGEPDRIAFEVTTEELTRLGGEAVLWLDGVRVGALSNLRFPHTLSVGTFAAGIHTYRIEIEYFDLEHNPSGKMVGRGHVLIQHGDHFRIVWSGGERPELVRQ